MRQLDLRADDAAVGVGEKLAFGSAEALDGYPALAIADLEVDRRKLGRQPARHELLAEELEDAAAGLSGADRFQRAALVGGGALVDVCARGALSVLEARFSVSAFEEVRRKNPQYWSSPRNDMARGIYGEAMREKQRLLGASDELLEAERQALRVAR